MSKRYARPHCRVISLATFDYIADNYGVKDSGYDPSDVIPWTRQQGYDDDWESENAEKASSLGSFPWDKK